MSAIDTIARSQAQTAITRYGKAIVLRRLVAGVRNAVTHKVEQVENSYIARALIEGYSAQSLVDTSILSGDLKLTIAAKAIERPEAGWLVDFNDAGNITTYTIISVEEIYSGELAALYVCQVRK